MAFLIRVAAKAASKVVPQIFGLSVLVPHRGSEGFFIFPEVFDEIADKTMAALKRISIRHPYNNHMIQK